MKILLFDMDGVLLLAKAYHRALRETVGIIGRSLGYRNPDLTQDDIDVFESVGVSSEWDSSAICSALMLMQVWSIHPNAFMSKSLPLQQLPMHGLMLPNFQAFFQSQNMVRSSGERAYVRAREALISGEDGFTERQVESIHVLLDGAHNIHESITHRIFQELVLGSDLLQKCYGLEAIFNVEGYLQTEDIPTLSREMHQNLTEWLRHPDRVAAIFTLRPSEAPEGFFDTPEAEMGLRAVDLEMLPLVGHGGLAWFAQKHGLRIEDLIKPSPVHVLAAIQRTLGATLEDAIKLSFDLALNGSVDSSWRELDGQIVTAFEDSIAGFESALGAKRVLEELDIRITLHLMGVSNSSTKQQALENGGATHIFEDLNNALEATFAMDSL